jgi:hypothetical protein
MAVRKGSGGVSSHPNQKQERGNGRDRKFDPTPHLQEVYNRYAEEELPDQLKDLIARLDQVDDEGNA